ncbi:maltotransferase domain-containing protein, partial [Corynebacterium stationis]|uniref:maltotransferase domain-containing protein n=2 Tax=Corynebacterium TaxID=1716 RepID=UPI001CD67E80
MTQRLGIDDVRPRIDNGNLAVKAVVGEVIPVTALVWREGHAAIAATLNVWSDRDPDTVATSTMTVDRFVPDRVHGIFTP